MSEADAPSSFLGTGWAFPPSFAAGGGEVVLSSGVENVHRSLLILLSTRTGERPMQESYGCDLDKALFEKIDQRLVNRITSSISNAVLEHESRIKLNKIDVSRSKTEASTLEVRLSYVVRGTNSRYNMVFPFYLNEAVAAGF
jgi:hypothetical protein